jgi:hypothetical protein
VLPDEAFIELVRSSDPVRPNLLRWYRDTQVAAPVVEHNGIQYAVRSVHESIVRELRFPSAVGSFATERELLVELSQLIDKFIGLPEKFTSLIGRVILATWVVEALETAPTLLIEGPDVVRGGTLIRLLHCLCRRALPISAVTPTTLCSLPGGMHFTLLLRQHAISSKLSHLLQSAAKRDNPILKGGELKDLFGAQAILCDAGFDGDIWPASSIRVPCVPIGRPLASLDNETQRGIVEEFQAKLLAFRFSKYREACATRFDASAFAIPLQGLANGLAAATPTDPVLQAELQALLHDENAAAKAASWVDLNVVIVEALLVFCREAKMQSVYIGAIAEMAEKILEGRGESRRVDPGEAGRRIKMLGFSTEPRDAQGIKLRLTNAVCVRVRDLAHQLDVPGAAEVSV